MILRDALQRVPAATFHDHVSDAAAMHPQGADNLTLHTVSTYVQGRCYLAQDGRSGYAVLQGGELVNVYSLDRGQGDVIVAHAVAHGARRLDCFEGHLTDLYARHGFRTVRTEPNWTPGGPAVHYMSRED